MNDKKAKFMSLIAERIIIYNSDDRRHFCRRRLSETFYKRLLSFYAKFSPKMLKGITRKYTRSRMWQGSSTEICKIDTDK